jgi:hypothetical protein
MKDDSESVKRMIENIRKGVRKEPPGRLQVAWWGETLIKGDGNDK